MKDLRYMSISINTEEPGIVSSRIRNTILKRVMWIQSQVYWQKIIVGVSVSLFMYTPVVTDIICRCIFIVYNIPLFHHVNTTFHSLMSLWNYIKQEVDVSCTWKFKNKKQRRHSGNWGRGIYFLKSPLRK